MNISDYLYVTEAAKYLGVSKNTLKNWKGASSIPVYRNPINNFRMYKKDDLETVLRLFKKNIPSGQSLEMSLKICNKIDQILEVKDEKNTTTSDVNK